MEIKRYPIEVFWSDSEAAYSGRFFPEEKQPPRRQNALRALAALAKCQAQNQPSTVQPSRTLANPTSKRDPRGANSVGRK